MGSEDLVIYVDVLIIENFIVNMFLLLLTFQSAARRPKFKWVALSSALGSFYVLATFYKSLFFLTYLPFKILVAFIMIVICSGFVNIKETPKLFLLFMGYTMGLAGICFFLDINKNPSIKLSFYITNFSYKSLMLSVMVSYILLYFLTCYVKNIKETNKYIYQVEIKKGNYKRSFLGFLDTGNELKEPFTRLPVVIVEKNILEKVPVKDDEIYFIPYTVIQGKEGKLKAFKADEVSILINHKKKYLTAMVAYCDGILSGKGEYQALLPRSII